MTQLIPDRESLARQDPLHMARQRKPDLLINFSTLPVSHEEELDSSANFCQQDVHLGHICCFG